MKPCFLAYASVVGVIEAAAPGVIIVTGRGNRNHDAFQQAKAKGATLLSYWNVLDVPDVTKDPQDIDQFMGGQENVPRWRFNGAGPLRSNWSGTTLADIRPGSAWRKFIVEKSGKVMQSGKFSGLFLDTLGSRPWGGEEGFVSYNGWPAAEQKLWTESCVGLAKELYLKRLQVAPKQLLIHNNQWQLSPEGDDYCNGMCMEKPPIDKKTNLPAQFHVNYAARPFGGNPRFMILIAGSEKNALDWLGHPGLTHMGVVDASKEQSYAKLAPLPVKVAAAMAAYGAPPAVDDAAALEQQIVKLRSDLDTANKVIAGYVTQVAELSRKVSERDVRIANAMRELQP